MSSIEVYTRTHKETGEAYQGITGHQAKTEHLGKTNLHSEPQLGHVLIFNGQHYRIKDVAHPTENEGNKAIFLPKVLVEVEDVSWLDGVV